MATWFFPCYRLLRFTRFYDFADLKTKLTRIFFVGKIDCCSCWWKKGSYMPAFLSHWASARRIYFGLDYADE